jgi:restriction endonuclease S subunit
MNYGLSESTVEKIRGVFAQFPEIEKAVLYGSRAKGNFKTGSDIDLTLYGAALTSDLYATIADRLDDLLLPYSIDLSLFDEIDHAKLREHIQRVGVFFYERVNQGVDMKAGWRTKTLGEVLQKTNTINPLQFPEVEFDYIDVSSVSNTTFQIEETQRLKGKDAPSRARRLVKTNDVIFATVRPTLRRIAIVPAHLDNQVCSTGYFVLRPKVEIDYRFVFYWLFTDYFMGQMECLQKGASYPAVTDGEVRSQIIPVPPLPEQQRIVAKLDSLSEETKRLESIYRQKSAALDELKKSLLHQAFSGEL